MLQLTEMNFEQMQPMRFGLNQFSVLAQFGEVEKMKVGLEYERRHNKVQCSFNQLIEEEKISKIEYNWKRYENQESALFFFRFKFYNRDDRVIGTAQNLSDEQFKEAILKLNY